MTANEEPIGTDPGFPPSTDAPAPAAISSTETAATEGPIGSASSTADNLSDIQ